jgi:hypothetical protein
MARTIPALVTERLTDAIALIILAGFSVTTYAGDKVHYLTIPAALIVAGLAVLASPWLSDGLLTLLRSLPVIGRFVPKVEEMLRSMRVCVAPIPLVVTVALSTVAWFAECLGYWLVFRGLDIAASLDVCTFLYGFATIAGGAMPGGLGVSDGALAGGAMTLIPGVSEAEGVATALLIRVATLWFGVGLGALALFKVSFMLGGTISLDEKPGTPPSTPVTGTH